MRRHTEKAHGCFKFKCSECDFKNKNRREFKRHMKKEHKPLKAFDCQYCGLTAKRKYNLILHLRNKHKLDVPRKSKDKLCDGSLKRNVLSHQK